MPNLHELPLEVLAEIVPYLSYQDVYNLMLSCKTLWNLIVSDNGIWRAISRTKLIVQDHRKSRNYVQSWYERCRISHNWCKGRFKNRNIISHNKNYMPWLKYHNSEALFLTVGSDLHCYLVDANGFPNGRQLQWKLSMPKLRRPDKRTDDISRFVLRDNILVCGNRNGSAAVYKIDCLDTKPERIQYIESNYIDHEISCVEISNGRDHAFLVTGSTDSPMLQFWTWDWDTRNMCKKDNAEFSFAVMLTDSHETVKCMEFNENCENLAIGPDSNRRPVVMDMNKIEFVIKSDEPSDVNQVVQDIRWHDNNTICYVTHAGYLEMIDIRTGNIVYMTRDPFDASFYCVKTDGNRTIVAGTSLHSRCVLFDTRKYQHTQIYFTQDKNKTSPVYSLDFDCEKLIAASDRNVAVLDFKVPNSTPKKDYSEYVYDTER